MYFEEFFRCYLFNGWLCSTYKFELLGLWGKGFRGWQAPHVSYVHHMNNKDGNEIFFHTLQEFGGIAYNVWQNSTFRGCLERVERDERMFAWNCVGSRCWIKMNLKKHFDRRHLQALKDTHISYWFGCWRLKFWSVYVFPLKYFKDFLWSHNLLNDREIFLWNSQDESFVSLSR